MRVADVLGPGSPLSRTLPGYEDRPGQLQMAEAVERALQTERHLFVEAGTGTGKTLAYLVPAILSGRKVVISTATRALEEQIFTKDLPLVREVFAAHGVEFRAALMKGLSNYLCKRRLEEAIGAGRASNPLIARIESWARETETGDRSELAALAEDTEAWHEVEATTDTRIGAECKHYDQCFTTRMRRDAEEAQVVIVNHHLFFADLALRRGRAGEFASAIPPYDTVIFDEAHQIENVATDFFGLRVSSARVESLVRDARGALIAAKLLDFMGSGGPARPILELLAEASDRFFGGIASGGSGRGDSRRILTTDDFAPSAQAAYNKLDACLEALAALAAANDRDDAVALVARRTRDLRSDLHEVILGARESPRPPDELDQSEPPEAAPDPNHEGRIVWLDVRDRSVSLGASPIDLGPLLRDLLFDCVPGVICTSATLATTSAGVPSFHFAKARLGAPPDTDDLVVESPFDFALHAGLYTTRDLPEPSDPAFEAAATQRIVDLVAVTGGGAFVLCTSNRAMRGFHRALRGKVPGPLLVQGEAPKHLLLSRFRAAGNAVLVATMSFWEGVDVPGHALRLVVLDKIPFAVPTDPIVAARCAQIDAEGGNSFSQYSVPAAAITLKQGFGRLLRTTKDSGIVAVLDRRILTKGYGKALLASLPPAARLGSLEEVREFWSTARPDAPSGTPGFVVVDAP